MLISKKYCYIANNHYMAQWKMNCSFTKSVHCLNIHSTTRRDYKMMISGNERFLFNLQKHSLCITMCWSFMLFSISVVYQVFVGWWLVSVCWQLDVGLKLSIWELFVVPSVFLPNTLWPQNGPHWRIYKVMYNASFDTC